MGQGESGSMQVVPERIFLLRQARGWSQTQLVERLQGLGSGATQPHLSEWEKGGVTRGP